MSRLSAAKRQVEALQSQLDERIDDIAILKRNVPGVLWATMRKWYPGQNSMVYDFRSAIQTAIRQEHLTRDEVIDWLAPNDEEYLK